MTKKTYINRYNDKIVFNKIDENTIELSGFEFFRTGYNSDEDNKILFIDPSGGPYLQVGDNIHNYIECEGILLLESIKEDKGKIILKVKKI